MKTIGLKKALQIIFGATNIKLRRARIDYAKELSGFFDGVDGKIYYVSAKACPACGLPPVMYREAKSRKDFVGCGNNKWDLLRRLELKGFALKL